MKFSYRVVVVGVFVLTLFVVYILFNDKLFVNRGQAGIRQSGFPRSVMQSKTDLRSVVQKAKMESNVCMAGDVELPRDGLSTYEIFNKIKRPYEGHQLIPFRTKGNVVKKFKERLRVFLIPHSHNDPGWLLTINQYYLMQTKPILDNMVEKLTNYPNMTFIWAESVFLSMWWQDIDDAVKVKVKELIKRGQLEIVNGGWVAPDEASTHYFAIIDQLIEGHQWLAENLGVKPTINWSPDPFGYSSTMPYILNRAGMKDMVILRIHDDVKAELRQHKNLEFYWRQQWDKSSGTSDTFCHLMPYVLYSIKHSCGPDPFVCLMFDFREIPGEYSESNPPTLTDSNIEKYSKLLHDEFRAKSRHFRHNVIFFPLGDDFRYDHEIEWDQQYVNYNKLFNYMNSRADWNVEARFGTLSDYFKAIKEEEKLGNLKNKTFPVLHGDFFPYMDRGDEYWTGFYTTRPFYKQLEREIEANLRTAEILNSFAVVYSGLFKVHFRDLEKNLPKLLSARRNLALFQHHDAITGTSKPHTVADYATKLWEAKESSRQVAITSAQYLLSKGKVVDVNQTKTFREYFLSVDDARSADNKSPQKRILTVTREGSKVVIFNPIAKLRQELIRLRVSSNRVIVTVDGGGAVRSQINPIWISFDEVSTDDYELIFMADLPPLGMKTFILTDVPHNQKVAGPSLSRVAVLYTSAESHSPIKPENSVFRIKPLDVNQGATTTLENTFLKATFNNKGLLESIVDREDNRATNVKLQFLSYSSSGSGAYLFQPHGGAGNKLFSHNPQVMILRGWLSSEVHVKYKLLQHTVRVHHTGSSLDAALEIENFIDLTVSSNLMDKEIIMHLSTPLHTGRFWYSDLNGFQIARRKTQKKYGVSGNYHPMTTMAYIEGNTTRLSLLSAQSHGVASLKNGHLEVMLDRMLSSDDARGLGEGVSDNTKTISKFLLLLEHPVTGAPRENEEGKLSYPSLLSARLLDQLLHPVTNFIHKSNVNFQSSFLPMSSPLPCDITLVNLKTLDGSTNSATKEIVAVFHRQGFQCDYKTRDIVCQLSDGGLEFKIFQDLDIKEIKEVTLSLMYEKRKLSSSAVVQLNPMEIGAYKMLFR